MVWTNGENPNKPIIIPTVLKKMSMLSLTSRARARAATIKFLLPRAL